MRYLKLFENFDDNKEVIDALEKILDCVENKKSISSEIEGPTLMELQSKCSDEEVMSFLTKAAEITVEEYKGKVVPFWEEKSVDMYIDKNKLKSLIDILKGSPEKADPKIKLERFMTFESLDNFHHISKEQYNLFSQVPALGELRTKNAIKLEKADDSDEFIVHYDENDVETVDILKTQGIISE